MWAHDPVMARGRRNLSVGIAPAPARAAARTEALCELLIQAGIPEHEAYRDKEGMPCAPAKADIVQSAVRALRPLVKTYTGREAEEMLLIVLTAADRRTGHDFSWDDPRGGSWSPGAGRAAAAWWNLPLDEDGNLIPDGLLEAVEDVFRSRPRETFLDALQHAPSRTLMRASRAPRRIIPETPAPGTLGGGLHGAVAVDAAHELAGRAGLTDDERDLLVTAARMAPPALVTPRMPAPGTPRREEIVDLLHEIAPVAGTDGLPVMNPTTRLGRLLADALMSELTGPLADALAEERRQMLGVADDPAYIARRAELALRSPVFSPEGRVWLTPALRREEPRLRAIAALAAGIDRPRPQKRTILRPV